eukprot:5781107-Pleurochrysis_carterae.AAC.2
MAVQCSMSELEAHDAVILVYPEMYVQTRPKAGCNQSTAYRLVSNQLGTVEKVSRVECNGMHACMPAASTKIRFACRLSSFRCCSMRKEKVPLTTRSTRRSTCALWMSETRLKATYNQFSYCHVYNCKSSHEGFEILSCQSYPFGLDSVWQYKANSTAQ